MIFSKQVLSVKCYVYLEELGAVRNGSCDNFIGIFVAELVRDPCLGSPNEATLDFTTPHPCAFFLSGAS